VALSPGEEPARAAAWVEGLVAGSGLLLLHDPTLLRVIDEWMAAVGDEAFENVLPLLRRSFSQFEAAERRMLGESVKSHREKGAVAPRVDLDEERAAAVLPLVHLLLAGKRQ
jgi:hypothetical protein